MLCQPSNFTSTLNDYNTPTSKYLYYAQKIVINEDFSFNNYKIDIRGINNINVIIGLAYYNASTMLSNKIEGTEVNTTIINSIDFEEKLIPTPVINLEAGTYIIYMFIEGESAFIRLRRIIFPTNETGSMEFSSLQAFELQLHKNTIPGLITGVTPYSFSAILCNIEEEPTEPPVEPPIIKDNNKIWYALGGSVILLALLLLVLGDK